MSLIAPDTWIIVANGRSVRVLRNVGSETALKLHQEPTPELDPTASGPSGSQPKEDDRLESAFVKLLAGWINRQALAHRFEALVLVADATSLGEIRPQLHKEVASRLKAEIAKDWTNMPLEAIEQALDAQRI